MDIDEHPRPSTTAEALAKLRPAFTKDPSGSVTAGNASGVNDGAAALILMDADRAKALGFEVLAFVGSSAAAGVAPRGVGIGPVPAIQKVMQRANLLLKLSILWNSTRPLRLKRLRAVRRWVWISPANVNGGGIAMGHPWVVQGQEW